jgi:hypothetical protein
MIRYRILYKIIFFIACSFTGYSQICLHKDLSSDLDFKTNIKRFRNPKETFDTCTVKIEIFKKSTNKKRQTIVFGSELLFKGSFSDCNSVRSYSTGKNKNVRAVDNDFGDLVIADYNFDGIEDLAIKKVEGGNGGPEYFFYLQDKKGNFVLDKFLTDKVVYFPSEINSKKHSIITIVHANAYQMNETTYQLNNGKWKQISQRFIP